MFSQDHEIWKLAWAADELDDWLPYAEDLVLKWSAQSGDEVKFVRTFDIILAAFLLKDDLLPAPARVAFAGVMLKAIDEASENKLKLECLGVSPPKSGRKENRTATFVRLHEVKALIQEGKSATEAYKAVAEKHHVSLDTIRRGYERARKKSRDRKEAGGND